MERWTIASCLTLFVVLRQAVQVGGQKGAPTDNFASGSESIRIEEIKYLWMHLQHWREKTEIDGNLGVQYMESMHARNESSSQPEKLEDLITEFTSTFNLCYNCVGILTDSGMRYGCTDTITEAEFSNLESSNASDNDLIVPCVGDCMMSRYYVEGSSTYVRSCSPGTCADHRNEKCSHRDGACVKCCNSRFCNREYPLSFLLQDQPGSSAGMSTMAYPAILFLLCVHLYFSGGL